MAMNMFAFISKHETRIEAHKGMQESLDTSIEEEYLIYLSSVQEVERSESVIKAAKDVIKRRSGLLPPLEPLTLEETIERKGE
jgi:hypothetical protein